MAVDYKAIADRAEQIIGSPDRDRAADAYNVMSAETVTREKDGEVRMNRRMLMRELGAMTADALLQKIKTGIENAGFSTDTVTYLLDEINGEGLDLKHPETQAMLQNFVDGGIMTQDDLDLLLGLINETIPAWPGLKLGEVQNALEMRANGEV